MGLIVVFGMFVVFVLLMILSHLVIMWINVDKPTKIIADLIRTRAIDVVGTGGDEYEITYKKLNHHTKVCKFRDDIYFSGSYSFMNKHEREYIDMVCCTVINKDEKNKEQKNKAIQFDEDFKNRRKIANDMENLK